jgi:hypothetical protein
MSHSVGDGRLFLTIITAAFHTALTGEVVDWPVQSAGRFPLAAAAFHTFGRRPALVKAAIDDRHQLEIGGESAALRPWTPARRTLHASMSRERGDEIFDWGKEFAPRASRFALQVTLVLKALKKVGLEISSDVRVVVDLRRYLGWRYIDGNFIAGVSMAIGAGMSPEQISSNIKATNASGRPLAGQIQNALRGGIEIVVPKEVPAGGLPRVTFTTMGRSPEIDSLPFLSEPATVYGGSVPPEGPLGVTILTGETSKVFTVDATFHDNVVDAKMLDEALNLIMSDPIGLLSETMGTP